MPPWSKWRTPHEQVVDVSVDVDIFATPWEVWSLIKPAENAVILEPSTLKAFHVPGTPAGVGEMQGFITRHDGREHIAIIEVVEELEGSYSITRQIGMEDDSYRLGYFLNEERTGTKLSLSTTFTIPEKLWDRTDELTGRVRIKSYELANRVKFVAESTIPYFGRPEPVE